MHSIVPVVQWLALLLCSCSEISSDLGLGDYECNILFLGFDYTLANHVGCTNPDYVNSNQFLHIVNKRFFHYTKQ